MEATFEVYLNDRLIFYSNGKWLHPLFDFEEFLLKENLDPATLFVKDKIVGKAAALLLVKFDIRHVHAGVLSEPGKRVMEDYNVSFSFDRLVKRISCKTEELLVLIDDLYEAYLMLKERAHR